MIGGYQIPTASNIFCAQLLATNGTIINQFDCGFNPVISEKYNIAVISMECIEYSEEFGSCEDYTKGSGNQYITGYSMTSEAFKKWQKMWVIEGQSDTLFFVDDYVDVTKYDLNETETLLVVNIMNGSVEWKFDM